jgi:phage shock protein E
MRFSTVASIAFLLAICACEKKEEASNAAAPAVEGAVADEPDQAAAEPIRDATVAWRMVNEQEAPLFDVRSQGEFDEGHVEGAALIPHDEISDRLAEVDAAVGGDKSKGVVVYCRSGNRSGKAQQTLLDAGYTNVVNAGGLSEWRTDCDEDASKCAE